MLKQHARRHGFPYPRHEPGEVVLVRLGNYLETKEKCTPKTRPAIVLRVGECQHAVAGLTTQSRYLTTGDDRPLLPLSATLGLNERSSYLWSARSAFITRLDVRRHLGWIDHAVVEFLAERMDLDASTFSMLWRSASLHAHEAPHLPR